MILIGLGANLPSHAGDPAATLRAALDELQQQGAAIVAVSQFHRSAAWPDPSQPEFVNAVARIETELSPDKLLALLHSIETAFGRHRSTPNAPRPLDLDLLDYNGVIQGGTPHLPHPRMTERNFVIIPLTEIAPDWRDPVSGKTARQLASALPPLKD